MPKTAWKALLFSIEKCHSKVAVMWFLIIVSNIAVFIVPYFLKLIADYALENETTFEVSGVVFPIVAAITLLLLHEIGFRIAHIVEIDVAVESFNRITSRLYHNLLGRPSSYFEDKFSGSLGRRVEQVGESIKYFNEHFPWEFGWSALSIIVSGVLLYIAHPLMFVGFLVWLVLFAATSYTLLKRQFRLSQAVTGPHATLSGGMIDTLANVTLVHSFGAEKKERDNFSTDMDSVIQAERKERWMFVVNKFQQGMSIVVLSAALILLSVYLFSIGELTVGDFILVATSIPTMNSVVWNIGDMVVLAIRNYGNLTDAIADLQTETERLTEGNGELQVSKGGVTFENLSFTYPGTTTPVFSNFDLAIKAGEKVGIVGSSGAGKSTLVKLLLRHYEVTTGAIEIDGSAIDQVTLHSLRDSVAFVPQDTTLFHRSLLENIQYARPNATKEEVIEASKRAHTHDFICMLPEGYDTKVGERGVKLSGGQRQRIAVARAMLKDAPILVLDEATSALDSESEEIVQKGLRQLFSGRTVIAIAHRLSTLKEMDRIVIIEDGKIVENGAPSVLLNKSEGIFKHMWEQQKGGFVT